ncbi:hypothetical protein [Methanobrevibacter sp.]|uniref:hypothetical protein n=1 Tax=Methanobrevibacter sp. TaxID=66852 RepID=UPI00388DA21F
METKNILLIVIVILVVALIGLAAYIYMSDSTPDINTIAENNSSKTNTSVNNTTDVIIIGNETPKINDTNNNTTYRVYNPQSDSYVTVIGEGYDAEVDRWYTYDTDGVRYYNTRIK